MFRCKDNNYDFTGTPLEEMYKSLIQEIVIHDEHVMHIKRNQNRKKDGHDVIQKTA